MLKKLGIAFFIVQFVAMTLMMSSVYKQQQNMSSAMQFMHLENERFKSQVFAGIGEIIHGETVISKGQLRIHHFIEPHGDKFYPNCVECLLEGKGPIPEGNLQVTAK